jgi:hypothetical protein
MCMHQVLQKMTRPEVASRYQTIEEVIQDYMPTPIVGGMQQHKFYVAILVKLFFSSQYYRLLLTRIDEAFGRRVIWPSMDG